MRKWKHLHKMKCNENKKKLCRVFSRSLTSYDVYCDIGHAAHAGVTRVLTRVRDTCHPHHQRGDCLVPLLCDQTHSTTTRVVRERLKQRKTFIIVKTDFQVGFSISHFHKYEGLKQWNAQMKKCLQSFNSFPSITEKLLGRGIISLFQQP